MKLKFVCLIAIIVSIIQSGTSLDCYLGDLTSSILANGLFSQTCPGAEDTCKLTITYLKSDIAFQAFPTSTFSCVNATADTDPNTGCNNCEVESLAYSLDYKNDFSFDVPANLPRTCNFKSADGLSTTYCSKLDNGNRPAISFSCYVGTFSAETPLKPSVCGMTLNSNLDFCSTSWNTDPNTGVVSAIGTCESIETFDNDNQYQYGDSAYQTFFCNGNNCNNVLICYTGTYYHQKNRDHSMENHGNYLNTFKASLCNYDANQVCQTSVTYNNLYGYTFQGECKAQGQCTTVPASFTGDSNTVGTYCCTTQYCNSIRGLFHLNINNSNQLKSMSAGLLFILLAFIMI